MRSFAAGLVFCLVAAHASAQPRATGYVTTTDGVRLYYEAIGRGRDTIIAAHGGPGETLANLYPALAGLARQHTLIVYDQRGNGRSSPVEDSTHITIDYHLQDLEAIRAHFHLARPVLLGHSWGGDLVALYVARHPANVSRLILVDPGPPRHEPFDAQSAVGRMAGFDSAGKATIRTLISAVFADTAKDPVALCRRFYEFYLKNYYVNHDRMKTAVADDCRYPGYRLTRANRVSRLTEESGYAGRMWDTLVTGVKVPVLVLHGAADFIPVESSATWARSFPMGRLLIIDGSSHSPFVDQPEQFFPAVETFLGGGWPRLARRPTPAS